MGFSPMAKANIAEVHRIAQKCGAKMLVLHIGIWDPSCERTYRTFLEELSIDPTSIELHTRAGEPVDQLLALCVDLKVDLLALGALQREAMFKVFTVSIARDMCRKAKISLLLLTHSAIEERRCKRIVVNGLDHPKTPTTLKTALWLGTHLQCTELLVVDELSEKELIRPEDDKSQLKNNRRRKQIARVQQNRLEAVLSTCEVPPSIDIREQHVFGQRGYTISHYAKAQKADLLVINSPDTKLRLLDRIFKHDLEYILADLPTDLLIV